jgi:hypothetical protein
MITSSKPSPLTSPAASSACPRYWLRMRPRSVQDAVASTPPGTPLKSEARPSSLPRGKPGEPTSRSSRPSPSTSPADTTTVPKPAPGESPKASQPAGANSSRGGGQGAAALATVASVAIATRRVSARGLDSSVRVPTMDSPRSKVRTVMPAVGFVARARAIRAFPEGYHSLPVAGAGGRIWARHPAAGASDSPRSDSLRSTSLVSGTSGAEIPRPEREHLTSFMSTRPRE